MLQYYNRIPGFSHWYNRNHYTLINDSNAKYYYILFQQDRKCAINDCANCNGEYISYEKEEDIVIGKLISRKCITLLKNQQIKQAELLKKNFKAPIKYEKITWENITILPKAKESLVAYAQKYPLNIPIGLYLYSKEAMRGKTSVLWVLIKDLITNLKLTNVVIKSTPMLLSKAREDEFSGDGINYTVKEAIYCGLLALDDFGIEKQTAWSGEKLYTILNERATQNRPTIIASYLEPDPILWQTPFEKSIIGKILESCICINLDTKE
jgi:DNA replication protein DnaC